MMNTLLSKHADLDTVTPASEANIDALSASDALTEQALSEMLNLSTPLTTGSDTMVLTAIHLGPHLQVITPQTAAPEGQSLELFARSQGLDEAALQWLMGTASATLSTGATGATSAAGPTGTASLGLTVPTPAGTAPPPDAAAALTPSPLSPLAPELTALPTARAGFATGPSRDGLAEAVPLGPEESAPWAITGLKLNPAAELL